MASSSSNSSSSSSSSTLKSTIWIGNIDTKSTEAQILKIVKPFGQVLKFDFIYTLKDNERVPRGYAFVTYDNYVSADKAIRGLNGLQVLSKNLKVQPASSNNTNVSNSTTSNKTLPATLSASLGSKNSDSSSKMSKIKALEAQLKALDKKPDQFKLVPEGKKARPKPYERKSWQWHAHVILSSNMSALQNLNPNLGYIHFEWDWRSLIDSRKQWRRSIAFHLFTQKLVFKHNTFLTKYCGGLVILICFISCSCCKNKGWIFKVHKLLVFCGGRPRRAIWCHRRRSCWGHQCKFRFHHGCRVGVKQQVWLWNEKWWIGI